MTQALTISSDLKTGRRRGQHRSGHSAVTPKMPPVSAAIAASAITLNLTARLLPQLGHNSILIIKKKKKKTAKWRDFYLRGYPEGRLFSGYPSQTSLIAFQLPDNGYHAAGHLITQTHSESC